MIISHHLDDIDVWRQLAKTCSLVIQNLDPQ